MIKRKPGRPRKIESTVEGAIPEKRKPGRPRKNAAVGAAPQVNPFEYQSVFEYQISVSNGYGTDVKKVRANSVSVEEGKLILRYGPRIVGAFSTWDDLTEMEQPQRAEPVVAAVTQQSMQNGGTGWGNTNGTFISSNGEPNVLTTDGAAPHIEIIDAERPE